MAWTPARPVPWGCPSSSPHVSPDVDGANEYPDDARAWRARSSFDAVDCVVRATYAVRMPDPIDPDESGPQARVREAETRTHELLDRLTRLQAGEPVQTADIDRALLAAAEAQRHSTDAHARAAAAHRRAAEAHRRAARVADETGHPRRAEQHRAAAEADDEAAQQDEAAARPPPTEGSQG